MVDDTEIKKLIERAKISPRTSKQSVVKEDGMGLQPVRGESSKMITQKSQIQNFMPASNEESTIINQTLSNLPIYY